MIKSVHTSSFVEIDEFSCSDLYASYSVVLLVHVHTRVYQLNTQLNLHACNNLVSYRSMQWYYFRQLVYVQSSFVAVVALSDTTLLLLTGRGASGVVTVSVCLAQIWDQKISPFPRIHSGPCTSCIKWDWDLCGVIQSTCAQKKPMPVWYPCVC